MDAYFLVTSSPIASPTYVNHHRLSRYITPSSSVNHGVEDIASCRICHDKTFQLKWTSFQRQKLPKLYSSLEHHQSLIQRQILRWCIKSSVNLGSKAFKNGLIFDSLSLLESEGPGEWLLSTKCMQKPQNWKVAISRFCILKSEGASLSESTWETRRKSTGRSSSSTKVTPVASAAAISNHSASEFTLNIRLRHI